MPKLAAQKQRRWWQGGRGGGKRRGSTSTLADQLRNTIIGASAVLLFSSAAIAIKTDLPQRLWQHSIEASWAFSGNLGLRVEELVVFGLHRTSPADARAALAIERGTPILRVNMRQAYERLVSLPWVQSANIRRQLPDKVVVQVQERQALAIWRNGRRIGIIDAQGEPIMPVVPQGLEHLPLITGDFANEAAPALVASLHLRPAVIERVAAASRIAGQRWDLVMDNGVIVRLPAYDTDKALDELVTLMKEQSIIERDLLAIDLRQDDRLLLDLPTDVLEAMAAEQKENS